MIPVKDSIPASTTPVVNYAILSLCGAVFLIQLSVAQRSQIVVERYGLVPARLTHPGEQINVREAVLVQQGMQLVPVAQTRLMADPPFGAFATFVTCMFLHGGWMHFIFNMLFLYIFGDNVEDRLGHVGYAVFYLLSGILAGLAHLVSGPNSVVPTIGASGAIAGVMGAYFLLYPYARVLTVIWVFFFLEFIVLPAWLLLGIWFVMQLFQGWLASATPGAGGVAWWAHIGGFAVGAGAIYVLRYVRLIRKEPPKAYPSVTPFRAYRGRAPW